MSALWMGKKFLEQHSLLYAAAGIVNWYNHLGKQFAPSCEVEEEAQTLQPGFTSRRCAQECSQHHFSRQ